MSIVTSMGEKEVKETYGWVNGTVVSHMFRDKAMPAGMVAPYQVKLDDGRLIFAPQDDGSIIRSQRQNAASGRLKRSGSSAAADDGDAAAEAQTPVSDDQHHHARAGHRSHSHDSHHADYGY